MDPVREPFGSWTDVGQCKPPSLPPSRHTTSEERNHSEMTAGASANRKRSKSPRSSNGPTRNERRASPGRSGGIFNQSAGMDHSPNGPIRRSSRERNETNRYFPSYEAHPDSDWTRKSIPPFPRRPGSFTTDVDDQKGDDDEQDADKTFQKTIIELRFEMCEQKDKAIKESEKSKHDSMNSCSSKDKKAKGNSRRNPEYGNQSMNNVTKMPPF